ncbi:MAG: DNA polymerase III subunit delta' [Candidatus Paraimprobicoccus trichonymphae]|uniref:DNA polymerase III subunit delta n=1 Tax=Candidatus Paraimprobicoccus trichonymphae TaxID=3033793 RepID=A0AA48IBW3_9FIRM|nr:MAG: DNA polymerase III subunit delta' [Candidatus Paraimprobicoccus trichonymphae]
MEKSLYELVLKDKLPHAFILESNNLREILEISKNIFGILISKINDRKLKNNIHPDFCLISSNKSKTLGIDIIREIKTQMAVLPSECSYRFFVITDGNLLTIQAQNALLKILEEPIKNNFLVILCKNSNFLLRTIISRVQVFSIKSKEKFIFDDNILEIANKIIKYIFSNQEFELVKLFEEENLKDRNCLKNIIKTLKNELKDILEKVSVFEILQKTEYLLEKNVNLNLLISWFCFNSSNTKFDEKNLINIVSFQ